MKYHTNKSRVLSGLFILIIVLMVNIYEFPIFLFVAVPVLLVQLIINFELMIESDYITYQIKLLRIPIYKRVLYPNQIVSIKFKRVSWMTKCVVVNVKIGLNIRMVDFTPDTVFDDLYRFAAEKDLLITKTRDYKILEM
ncbi:hypothetical protein [Pseudalkalibacillus decolorationis]|uniref:hypothetical protein n=1 Tax=Pseudalkalibacillus decolorationis TaxID=163879 RepID=UPI002147CF49|nr:hypothetical protein [Pseudalkalibacillus decolorationis]